ncbi:MAG: hypothetical protein J0L93_05730 [Deltaproteobacteria bacterium]|nr:hypothetical protein [Deltaproteobacteria bacterium]
MEEYKFKEKINLISDPYFDREFFTNLIYCIDRKKTIREVFEAVMNEIQLTPSYSEDFDRALLQLFYSYQASSFVRENYQWLPLTQGIYSIALQRGKGQKPLGHHQWLPVKTQASTPEQFDELVRKDLRAVESQSFAWGALLFLLDNRTTRAKAVASIVKHAVTDSDPQTVEMMVKAFDIALSSGWKANSNIMKRPFDRFWKASKAPEFVAKAAQLSKSIPLEESATTSVWKSEWTENLWKRISEQSVESAWEYLVTLFKEGAGFEQAFALLGVFRGRCLFSMKTEQWPYVTASLSYSEALQSSARWVSEEQSFFLAISLFDLVQLSQRLQTQPIPRPTGATVLDGVSKNISKDRLILRLDDKIELGHRADALDLSVVILNDEGLSHSISDRLILMASKQDGWTFGSRTISTAMILVKAFDECRRLGMNGETIRDAVYGLIRFLTDQRALSLQVVPLTGTYGEGMKPSQFDVSGGARIVDRFVFNQMRNAQRIKIWPSDN